MSPNHPPHFAPGEGGHPLTSWCPVEETSRFWRFAEVASFWGAILTVPVFAIAMAITMYVKGAESGKSDGHNVPATNLMIRGR